MWLAPGSMRSFSGQIGGPRVTPTGATRRVRCLTKSASSTDRTPYLVTTPKSLALSFPRAPAVLAVPVDAFYEVQNQKRLEEGLTLYRCRDLELALDGHHLLVLVHHVTNHLRFVLLQK